MLDQEQRLIEIHSLLVAPVSVNAPAPYREGELSLGLEIIAIPTIDGTSGGKREITASDRTPVFPRLRLALGLPAPADFRAFVGIGYIPPFQIRQVSSHLGALEAGIAYAPGPLAVGLRAHFLLARSMSPVTDPDTRDTLDDVEFGANVAAGYQFDFASFAVTPYVGVGVTRVNGDFNVTSDNHDLSSHTTNLGLSAGVRLFTLKHLEGVAELEVFPGRLVHPSFRLAYVFELWR